MHDNRVCPICASLEGYQWIFETGKDIGLPTELIANGIVVWNISQGSEAHGKHSGTCRCGIDHQFNLSDLVQKAQNLLNDVEAAVQQ